MTEKYNPHSEESQLDRSLCLWVYGWTHLCGPTAGPVSVGLLLDWSLCLWVYGWSRLCVCGSTIGLVSVCGGTAGLVFVSVGLRLDWSLSVGLWLDRSLWVYTLSASGVQHGWPHWTSLYSRSLWVYVKHFSL